MSSRASSFARSSPTPQTEPTGLCKSASARPAGAASGETIGSGKDMARKIQTAAANLNHRDCHQTCSSRTKEAQTSSSQFEMSLLTSAATKEKNAIWISPDRVCNFSVLLTLGESISAHAAHVAHAAAVAATGCRLFLLREVGDEAFGGQQQTSDARRV